MKIKYCIKQIKQLEDNRNKQLQHDIKMQNAKDNLEIEKVLLKGFLFNVIEKVNNNSRKTSSKLMQRSLLDIIGDNERQHHCNIK